jgi:hypothetical protein
MDIKTTEIEEREREARPACDDHAERGEQHEPVELGIEISTAPPPELPHYEKLLEERLAK